MPRKQILLYLDTQLLFPIVVPRKLILLFLEVTGKHKHIKKPIVVPRKQFFNVLEHLSLFPIVVPRKQILLYLDIVNTSKSRYSCLGIYLEVI